jgi:multiple sugar transport system permease protein
MLYPILNTFWMSLNQVNQFGQSEGFVGLHNYATLFADPAFRASLLRTLVWTAAVVVVTTVLSLFLAFMLNLPFPGRAVVRGLLLLPWASSLLITTLMWQWIANPDFGDLNHLLAVTGTSHARIDWLARPDMALGLMIWIAIWVSTPPTTLMLLAGMQSIPGDVYEACALDGARTWATFRDMTLPLLRPVLAVTVLLNVIFVFNSFPIIWVLTQGGPAGATDTLVTYLYKQGFQLYQVGVAASVSVVIFIVLLVFAVIHTRLTWRNVLREEAA